MLVKVVLALTVAVATGRRTGLIGQRRLSETNAHAHGHGRELCGCAQFEADHPFTIDCSDGATIRAAAATLNSAQCGTPSSSTCATTAADGTMPCQIAFFIVQAHHDYCDHDTLTTAEEELVHDWEAHCLVCGIERQYEASLEDCPRVNCQDTSIIDSAYWILNTTCMESSGDGHAHRRLSADEFEWGGVFPDAGTLTAGTYTWVAQATLDGVTATSRDFVDPAMKIIFYSATSAAWNQVHDEDVHNTVNTDMAATCTNAPAGTTLALGTCYNLQFSSPSTQMTDTWPVTIPAGTNYVTIWAEHVPTEFEFDTHYLNLGGTDIEPAVQTSDGHCCNNAHQIGAFKQVVAYHDLCDHDDIPIYVETGLHAYEANCASYFCNAIGSTYNGAACPSPPSPPTPPPPALEASDDLPTGGLIAIIAAGVVIVLLFGCLGFMYVKEKAGTPVFTNMATTPSAGSKAGQASNVA